MKRLSPLRSETDVALYISFSPQLIAGFVRLCSGLFKKVMLANSMAALADNIFNRVPAELTQASSWLGAIAYTFQIYFDFSGYSDMALGLGGGMFGFLRDYGTEPTSPSLFGDCTILF